MGARVSDRIGAAPLLRIDEVHHRIALFPVAARGRAARESPGARCR
jgi:2,3-dihydroxy-p-cumate/2,3-dihydroxybenzoate 3,4-dioxygenase